MTKLIILLVASGFGGPTLEMTFPDGVSCRSAAKTLEVRVPVAASDEIEANWKCVPMENDI
ncbi:MAG: hypothetical protein ABW146_08590 [Candidatus Sedimenticola sp. 6PFRAG7]